MKAIRFVIDVVFGLVVLGYVVIGIVVLMALGRLERWGWSRVMPPMLVTLALVAWMAACLGAWGLR